MNRRNFLGYTAAATGFSFMENPFLNFGELEEIQLGTQHTILQKHRQYNEVCYGPVLNKKQNRSDVVFIRYENGREWLMHQVSEEALPTKITEAKYLYTPTFYGDHILWIEGDGKNWNIKKTSLAENNTENLLEDYWGRPHSLYLAEGRTNEINYLVWEERQGMSTKIFAGLMQNGFLKDKVQVGDAAYNSYDPVITIDEENILHIVYCAFINGNYRIMHQVGDADLQNLKSPKCVSDSSSPCLRPSVWPRKKGGVWISYTDMVLTPDFAHFDFPYVQHHRRRKQHEFFRSKGLLMVRAWMNGEVYAPYASPNGSRNGFTASGIVFGSDFSKLGQVFESENGELGIVYRRHQQYSNAGAIEKDFISNADKHIRTALNTRSDLVVSFLGEKGWTAPKTLVLRAHYELPISIKVEKEALELAFVADGRSTGWSEKGECFDKESEIALGKLNILKEKLQAPKYEMSQLYLKPNMEGNMEEPISKQSGKTQTVYGQTHLHTTDSICTRAYDQGHHSNYRFMQDVQKCRFAGITDHSYNMGPLEQHKMREIANYYYFPGEFVALQAYEWTSKEGHVNPLSFEEEEDLQVYNPNDEGAVGSTFKSLWEVYENKKVVAPPHHVADYNLPFEWKHYKENLMPVVEIFQDRRGSGEQPHCTGITNYAKQPNGYWIVDEVKKGKKIGFIAGGDHSGLALAALNVLELTRTELYKAFQSRSCFATTGHQLKLSFIKGADLQLSVEANENIDFVEIVHQGSTVENISVKVKNFKHKWGKKPGFWYCRIVQENGDVCWASPIWIS
ncbi:hypothetical protein [Galbibacter mesophilus]|uniref:hypothetical protein n=1 Tax=Galbibacter mesophilus TaxID=379069 RepID=UPI00191F1AFC|nr:hypothetical protein [Galbibacter mesophilus]MCM5664339.1 hypothetical protein [Galbibacter mesophilus]